jgi:PAS domain S-box-containing protein
MRDGFVLMDMRGYIKESNEIFQEMLGFSGKELSAMTYFDLTSEKRLFEQKILEGQTLQRGFSDIYKKECLKKDGSILPVELRTFLIIDEKGECEGMWTIARDITQRKQEEKEREKLQEQLSQAQKMESIGRLAGGVAHDFNNMLGIIMGYAELAIQKTKQNGQNDSYLNEILDAAELASEITQQLLAFARKQTINPKALDLNINVDGMLKMLRRLIGEDIDLLWHPAPDL